MSFCQTSDQPLSNSPFLFKICLFRNSVIVKVALFVIWFEFCSDLSCILPKFVTFAKICYPRKTSLITNRPFFAMSFGKPFITSCQSRYFRQICHSCKNRHLTTCQFLSFHLNIWPNPWWMFGTLTIFVEICLLSIFPSLSPHLRFYQIVDGFLLNSPFSRFVVSLSQSLPNSPVRFAKYVIFVKATITHMPLLSSCFNFCQTLNKFFPNLSFS